MLTAALRILVLLIVASLAGCAAKKSPPTWPVKGKVLYVSERLVPSWRSGEIRPHEEGADSGEPIIPLEEMRTPASYPPCQALEVSKVTRESLHLWHTVDGQVFELTGKWESLVHDTREECLEHFEPVPLDEGPAQSEISFGLLADEGLPDLIDSSSA